MDIMLALACHPKLAIAFEMFMQLGIVKRCDLKNVLYGDEAKYPSTRLSASQMARTCKVVSRLRTELRQYCPGVRIVWRQRMQAWEIRTKESDICRKRRTSA